MSDVSDLLREQRETPGRRKIYKELSDEHRADTIASNLDMKAKALRESIKQNRIDWDNLRDIQKRCLTYLENCRDAQSIPTVSGLCAYSLGISRQSLNLYMREHPGTETTQFLQRVKDVFADLLETSALNNNINSIMAIFVMKNDHDRADRVQVEPVPQADPLGTVTTAEDLASRYGDLPED